MANEVIFNAVKGPISMLGGFFAEVAKEVGEDKAVELYAKQGTEFGSKLGNIIKSHIGQPDAPILIQQELKSIYESFGLTAEFEQEDGKLIASTSQCPFYEGLLEAGLKPETIHKMCHAFAAQETIGLKEIVPNSSQTLTEFRTSIDGSCREEFLLGI